MVPGWPTSPLDTGGWGGGPWQQGFVTHPASPRDGVPRHSVWVRGVALPWDCPGPVASGLPISGAASQPHGPPLQSNQVLLSGSLHGCAQQMVQTLHSGLAHKFTTKTNFQSEIPWRQVQGPRQTASLLPESSGLPVVVGGSPRGPPGGPRAAQLPPRRWAPLRVPACSVAAEGWGGLSTQRC